MDEVVPGWMCLQGLDVQQRAFLGGHFFSSRIESTIKSSVHLESLARSRVGDEIYDDIVAFQWSSTPVEGYLAEQAVLDLVPFARTSRKMADLQVEPSFIGESLRPVR